MDSSKEAGKEDFELQDWGVEESEDRRIGDEIEHEVGFGGIEALTRKCIMDKRNMFSFTFESSIDHCQLPWCEISLLTSTPSAAPITNERQQRRTMGSNDENDVRVEGNGIGVCFENTSGSCGNNRVGVGKSKHVQVDDVVDRKQHNNHNHQATTTTTTHKTTTAR